MTKSPLLAALCALAAACGGKESLDPAKVAFTYPAGAPVVAGSPEAVAVGLGEIGVRDAQALPGESDPTLATSRADSIVSLPEAVAGACMGSSTGMAAGLAAPAGLQARVEKRAVAFAAGEVQAAVAGFADPACVSVAPGAITFSNCTQTSTDPVSGTETLTVDGTISRTVAGGSATAAWDVRVRLSSTDGDFAMDVASHYSGAFHLTAATLAGHSRTDAVVNVSVPGTAVSAEVTHLADYDLLFAADPFCVTGGTLEVRRVWTRRPAMGDPAQMQDQGVKLTWLGCGLVNVARGTRN